MKNIISIVMLLLFVSLSVNAQEKKQCCEQTKTCTMDKKACSEEQMKNCKMNNSNCSADKKTCSSEDMKNCKRDKNTCSLNKKNLYRRRKKKLYKR